mmetsp:Transcript_41029/g.88519  ORF Transcript_41029/g.88519 Transcript_41029/m.88519 type:complete len:391 (-) Transcript_41029:275-1447(-)
MKVLEVCDLVCKVGENSQENWELVDRAKKGFWFFHLTDFPSPYVVLECGKKEPTLEMKEQCAQICANHSKQKATKNVKVDATICSNVRVDRKDAVGECDYRNEEKVEIILANVSEVTGTQGGKSRSSKKEKDIVIEKGAGNTAAAAAAGHGPSSPDEKFVSLDGKRLSLQKNKTNGFALLSFKEPGVAEALLRTRSEVVVKGGIVVKIKSQVETADTSAVVPGGVFATWGRKVEEKTPVSEKELLKCFEALAMQISEQLAQSAPDIAVGDHLQVRKAAAGGCAVITFANAETRNAVLALGSDHSIPVTDGSSAEAVTVAIKVKPQLDPKTKEEITTALFVAWGRKAEETHPLSAGALLKVMEMLHIKVATSPSNEGDLRSAPGIENPGQS